jgi:hypothetical protein
MRQDSQTLAAATAKALLHDSLGVPECRCLSRACARQFNTGKTADFANIIVGTPGGGANSKAERSAGFAAPSTFEGLDSHCTIIPPAPSVTTRANCRRKQVEHYWGPCSPMCPFTDYATNALAGQAVA